MMHWREEDSQMLQQLTNAYIRSKVSVMVFMIQVTT